MTDKYEKLDLNLVSIFSKRDEFASKSLFWHHEESNEFILIESEYDLMTYGAENNVYVKIETPWWESCEDSVIMVHIAYDFWRPAFFYHYMPESKLFNCSEGAFKKARPLTKAEKDAIITEG